MKNLYLKFDFPDLEPHEALWLLTNDLAADAYHIEDGRPLGIRNMELSARYIDLRRQALVGIARERIAAFRKSEARDSAETKTAKAGQKSPCR